MIRSSLSASLDAQLVNELLEAYEDAKKNFYAGGNRLSGVEAGRFCEAALRLLEQIAFGTFTPLSRQVDSESVIRRLSQLTSGQQPDAVRLQIPRAIRLVYDIRNNRDLAHLRDGIDPNNEDATLVAAVIDWILAELVRLRHEVNANEAQRIVDDLVRRRAPVVETLDGQPMVLRPDLGASEHTLVLLYERGADGGTLQEIRAWSPPAMRSNMPRTLEDLNHSKRLIRESSGRFFITSSGRQLVEQNRLFEFPESALERRRTGRRRSRSSSP